MVERLLGDKKADFVKNTQAEYQELRERHEAKQGIKKYVSYEQAKSNKLQLDWQSYTPTAPSFLGTRHFEAIDLEVISKYIDWTPFFTTWELRGKFPAILEDEIVGKQATDLYADAKTMLKKIIEEKWLQANAVVGFWPAGAENSDNISVFHPERSNEKITAFHTLRQQNQKAPGQPNISLSDFIAPKETGVTDYIGGFIVTAGKGIEKRIEAYEVEHDDYNSIMLKALADRLAEALAEHMHELVRKELWGYQPQEHLENDDLISEKYQGIRPAPGYPACPDHTEKQTLFDLLDPDRKTGVTLTESFAMWPAASVSGLYFSHPDSKYFGVGKIGKDQVENYAGRKQMELDKVGRWLSTNLNYNS